MIKNLPPLKPTGQLKREKLKAWHEANATYERLQGHVEAVDTCVANIMGKPTPYALKCEAMMKELHRV